MLSIRDRYGSPTTGVRAAVERWRVHRGSGRCDDLDVLATTAPESIGEVLRNRQRIGGQTKAAAIADAARRLTTAGVRNARDLDPRSVEHRRGYVSVHGLGQITWQYFLMQLGHSHVKPDTWVMRFVIDALGRPMRCGDATVLLHSAAERMSVDASDLDHAIWADARRSVK